MTLTEAIVVRISHDLAGAAGAFMNTVDLMKMDAGFIAESVGILETSSAQLTARLAFFRALYGAETKTIDASLVKKYLATLAVPVQFEGTPETRLQLALIAAGLGLLGAGGALKLEGNSLVISGDDLHHDVLYVQALMGSIVPADPKIVPALWLQHLAEEEKLALHLSAEESAITLSVG